MLRFVDLPLRSFPLQTEPGGHAPDDSFGPFRVLHQIGAGVLGPVFRAYDPESERLVAIKLFRLDLPPERVPRRKDVTRLFLGRRILWIRKKADRRRMGNQLTQEVEP